MGAQLSGGRDNDGGFLDRWSRRKREASEELTPRTAEPAGSVPDAAKALDDPDNHDAITPEELAALPKPEEIDAGTDIRPFLRRGVPKALKTAALRRIWMLTPAIRDHRDLAVDYAWDWNTPGGVPGSSGKVDAKGVADLIARLGKGRLAEEEGAETLEVASQSRRDNLVAEEAQPVGSDTPAPAPIDAGKAKAKMPRKTQDEPAPRHGSARPE